MTTSPRFSVCCSASSLALPDSTIITQNVECRYCSATVIPAAPAPTMHKSHCSSALVGNCRESVIIPRFLVVLRPSPYFWSFFAMANRAPRPWQAFQIDWSTAPRTEACCFGCIKPKRYRRVHRASMATSSTRDGVAPAAKRWSAAARDRKIRCFVFCKAHLCHCISSIRSSLQMLMRVAPATDEN